MTATMPSRTSSLCRYFTKPPRTLGSVAETISNYLPDTKGIMENARPRLRFKSATESLADQDEPDGLSEHDGAEAVYVEVKKAGEDGKDC